MNSSVFVAAVLLCLCMYCTADTIPRQYELNLDYPPRFRWLHIYRSILSDPEESSNMYSYFNYVERVMAAAGCDAKCKARMVAAFKLRYPDYFEELDGISEASQRAITIEFLVAAQATYEFSILSLGPINGPEDENDLQLPFTGPGCTSVLTCDKNRNVLHGRNLDWSNARQFAKTMFRVNFTRGKKVLFQSDQLYGNVGVLTGVRPNGFSVSINARRLKTNPTLEQFLNCYEDIPLQPTLPGFRYYLENSASYDDVIANLTKAPYCAPRYSIIGGAFGRGGRFQHNMGPNYEQHSVLIDKEELQCTDNSWYVAQCNSDLNFPRANDTRRDTVMKELDSEGREYASSTVGLFRAMTVPKVKNVNTVHTSVMSPLKGSLVTIAYDI